MRLRTMPVLLLATAWAAARAQDPLTARALDFEVIGAPAGWQMVAPAALDGMRGGFTTPEGLTLSLGIDRMVSINGEVVARTSFQIADMRNISGDEARQAQAALNAGQLVQNGAGNLALGDTLAAARGTFVQNSLDGQAISTQTIINSSVNSMSLLKDMNFQAGLRDAGIRAIGSY
ncbi:MAG TPA: hypothetical protein VFS02_03665 [Telluria sp.]|nr:hypothetical protein [Telluria sp.]